MTQSRSRAQTSSKPDSSNPNRLYKASPSKSTTRSSRSTSSSIIKTNEISSLRAKKSRVMIDVEDDHDEITIDKITINKIKEELRQREVPVPSGKNKPFLFELLLETKRKRNGNRDRREDLVELKKLLAKHGNLLRPQLIRDIENAYIVPTASKDEKDLPVGINAASQQDRVRCSQITRRKATKAPSKLAASATSGPIDTQQAFLQPEHQVDDGRKSTTLTRYGIAVDRTGNTPYDAMLYCEQPLDNINKLYHLHVSNHAFVQSRSA
jgi:hypothetical protein